MADLRGINLAMQTPMHADGSIMPRETVQLYQLVSSGDYAGAMALWSRMLPSLLCIWRGYYIPKVKAAARLRGFDGGAVRAPLRNLAADAEHELARCLETLDQE